VFSLAVSGGRERSALVWQPASRRRLAELTGHASSIMHLAFDEQSSQVRRLISARVVPLAPTASQPAPKSSLALCR